MYTTNSDVHNYTTRQKHLLHVNKSNINIYSKRFVNTSARIWNAMQSEIEVNVSISNFKISSKMYLQEHTLHFKYSKWDYYIIYHVLILQHITIFFLTFLTCISITQKRCYILFMFVLPFK